MTDKPKSKRGFASWSPEKRAEAARKGGKAVKPENRHYAQDRISASEAGVKGRQSQLKAGSDPVE